LIKAFKQKAIILTNIKDIPQPLEITYRAVDEYYFFSPVLSGDKNDNRLFSVVIGYTLYSELGAKDPSLKSSEIAQKFNSEFILKNQKTETLLKEAQRIIESFNYSLVPQAQGSPAEIFPSPQIDSVATGEPQAVEFPKLSLSKLQELQGYLHKGDKLFWDKQYKEAITELEKALSINPYHAPTLYYLGRAYFYMDQVQRAMEYYQRVLRIAPNYPEGYLGMGQVSASLSRYQEAIKYYRKALEMSPDNVEVYINLGYLYKTMAKFQEARENLQKARQILERKDDKRALSIIDEYLNDIPQ
jgi:tetratricopeptide (TPR) repeat protein